MEQTLLFLHWWPQRFSQPTVRATSFLATSWHWFQSNSTQFSTILGSILVAPHDCRLCGILHYLLLFLLYLLFINSKHLLVLIDLISALLRPSKSQSSNQSMRSSPLLICCTTFAGIQSLSLPCLYRTCMWGLLFCFLHLTNNSMCCPLIPSYEIQTFSFRLFSFMTNFCGPTLIS